MPLPALLAAAVSAAPAAADATATAAAPVVNSAAAESNVGLLIFQIIAMPLLVIGLFVLFMFTVGFILDQTVGRFGVSPASNGIFPPSTAPGATPDRE